MISNKLLHAHPKFRALHGLVHFSYQFTLSSHTNHNTISPSKHLKLLLILPFLMLSSLAFAGPFGLTVWHPAVQTTAGTFPENYTFNGTLNVTASTVTGTNFYISPTGNVSIGSGNPTARFEITGSPAVLALNVNNTLYVNTTTSSVGIGTASPYEKLQINGSIFLTATTVSNATVSYNSSDLILQAYGSNGTAATTTPNVTFRNVANTGNLSFRLGIFTNNTERMSIDSSGNVGIGTTSPLFRLSIAGSSAGAGIFINNTLVNKDATIYVNDAGELRFRTDGGNDRMTIQNGTGNVGIGTTTPYRKLQINGSGGVSFETNESTYLAAVAGQKVGIGNTAPASTLEVTGSANVLALNVNNTLYVNTTTSNVGIGTTASNHRLTIAGGTLGIADAIRIDGSSSGAGIVINNTAASGGWIQIYNRDSQSGELRIRTGSSTTDVMTITSGGSVGIGTATPSAKLSVSGNITLGSGAATSGRALCWMANNAIGYCSSQPDTNGACTCNAIT